MTKVKVLMRYFVMLAVLAGGAFLQSCDDDEETPPVAIAFSAGNATSISENGGSATVTVELEDFAPAAGSFTISVENGANTSDGDYTTTPAATGGVVTVEIAEGAQSASFSIAAVDNSEVDGNKSVTFTLNAAEGGIVLGTVRTSYTLTISDDEIPQTVGFAEATAEVMETGVDTVYLALSGAPGQESTVTIGVANNANITDADYTTDPAVSGGEITLTVPAGVANPFFVVTPVNNEDLNEDERVITFTVTAATGGLELATSGTSLAMTVVDDEVPVTSIIDVKGMWVEDTPMEVTDMIIVQGIVTSSNDNLTSRNFFIQDETAGIAVRFEGGGDGNMFVPGDMVELNLMGAEISDFRGLIQINELPYANATLLSSGNDLPAYQIISVAELNNNDFQGLLVEIQDVSFANANGVNTLAGSNSFTDGENTATFRVESYAPFADTPQPIGTGTLRGVASIFDDPQLVPMKAEDIFENAPTAEITVSTEDLGDFGSVETDMASTDTLMYTVSATGLTEDVMVDAPDAFRLSLTKDGTYGIQVALDGSAGSITDQEVWVVFTPTSGTPAAYSEAIRHTTAGAIQKEVMVAGTETIPATVIAYTSFEEPSTGGQYQDTGDAAVDHDLVNNEGQAAVDFTSTGGEMGFDATYVATREGEPGLTDGDFVGVTDFANNVGAFTDGSQGYQMSDTDGKMVLTFDEVDVTGFTAVTLRLDLFVDGTGYEADDLIHIYVVTNDGTIDILNTAGSDINDLEIEEMWMNMSADLSGKTTATLVIELDSNSGAEAIYFDNILFLGEN